MDKNSNPFLFKKKKKIPAMPWAIKFYMQPSALKQQKILHNPNGGKKKNLYKRLIMVTGPAKPDNHKHFLLLCNKWEL